MSGRQVSSCLRGSEDSISEIVTNLLVKIQREIEKIQAEADKLDKAIDESKGKKV